MMGSFLHEPLHDSHELMQNFKFTLISKLDGETTVAPAVSSGMENSKERLRSVKVVLAPGGNTFKRPPTPGTPGTGKIVGKTNEPAVAVVTP